MRARTLIAFFFLCISLVLVTAIPGLLPSVRDAFAVGNAPAASAVCKVDEQVNQWTGGFVAQLQLTNYSTALSSWKLTWTFAGDQVITSSWNTQVTQVGSAVTAINTSSNGALPTNGVVQFGFQATYSGANAVPIDFALNGVSCGDSSAVTPTPTSPVTTPTAVVPTPTPTPIAGTSCAKAVFCDGFESQTGATPTGVWQVSYPNCQGTGTVSVDKTVAHSGSTSIRVNGTDGYCNHVFFGTSALATVGTDIYVRLFIRHTTALPVGHVAFAAMQDTNDGGNDLRLGGQNAALQWNRQSDDATLPAQSPVGVSMSMPLPINQWSCLEYEVNEAQGTMRTWLNGSEVAGLHLDGTPTPDVDAQWLSRANWRPALTDLRLGWESYSGGADTLWFDDVAIGSQQIGCS